jgi:hypothetical protein
MPTPDQFGQGGLSIIPALLLSIGIGFFAVIALVGVFAVLIVSNRADPDPTGRRPLAVYFFGVSFFALFITLFGSFAIVLGLVQLIGRRAGVSSGPSLHPVGDAVARVAIVGGIVTVVALGVLVVHIRRGLEVSGRADPRTGPLGRVAQSYVASVSFIAVILTSVSAAVVLYELVRIVAPGVFAVSGSRVDTLRPMLAAAYLALASLAVLVVHMRFVPPEVRRVRWPAPAAAPPYTAPPPPPGPLAPESP